MGLLLVAACSSGEPPAATHQFAVTMEDGVEVALTTGGAKYQGEIFEYEQIVVLRPDPGVEESFLFSPQWMTTSEDGRIFVGDMGDRQVVVFSAAGEYLYRIGREGEGPGEFQSVLFVDIADDVLWVTEPFRHHAFELDGTFIETVSLPLAARSLMRDGRWWRLDDGRFVILNIRLRDIERGEAGAEMLVVDADGEVEAHVATPTMVYTEYLEQPTEGSRPVPLTLHFAARPWGDFAPEYGFVLIYPPEPEVLVYDIDGTLKRRLRVDLPPQPVTDEDRARVKARLDAAVRQAEQGGFELNGEFARVRRANPRYADPKHYWSRPIIDDRGFLWLLKADVRDPVDPTYRYDIFSPEGEYLGETTPPGPSQPSHGKLLTMWEDPETGEEYPVVYRVVMAADSK